MTGINNKEFGMCRLYFLVLLGMGLSLPAIASSEAGNGMSVDGISPIEIESLENRCVTSEPDRHLEPVIDALPFDPMHTVAAREAAADRTDTEYRIWLGSGSLLRIKQVIQVTVSTEGEIGGNKYFYFEVDSISSLPEHALDGVQENIKRHCVQSWRDGEIKTCALSDENGDSVQRIYAELESRGLSNLVHMEPENRACHFGALDGTSLLFEIRRGSDYQAFEYHNPRAHKEPDARMAATMLGYLESQYPEFFEL